MDLFCLYIPAFRGVLLSVEKWLSGNTMPRCVVFANYHGVNTPAVAYVRLPIWHHHMQSWERMHTIGSCKPAPASSSTSLPAFQLEPTFLFLVENMSPASLALPPRVLPGEERVFKPQYLAGVGYLTLSPTVLSLLFMPAHGRRTCHDWWGQLETVGGAHLTSQQGMMIKVGIT